MEQMTAMLECLSLPLMRMHPALGRGTAEGHNGLAVSFGSKVKVHGVRFFLSFQHAVLRLPFLTSGCYEIWDATDSCCAQRFPSLST